MKLKPHSPEWYDRLAGMQQGYYYPWKSTLPTYNGEDVYLDLVRQHLTPATDVLDVAGGHGEVAIQFAPACRSILAYDRIADYIRIAQESARQKRVKNVTFLCADSSAAANGGRSRLPAGPESFDLIISRRGPLHWIEDARRVARAGAVLIQLNPLGAPPPPWNNELPGPLRLPELEGQPISASVEWRLTQAGLEFNSYWTFIVSEFFPDPRQLYIFRTWGEAPEDIPTFPEVQPDLERIFARHAGPDGLPILRGRFLWKSVVKEKMSYLVHLCQRSAWEQALASGDYRTPSLEKEGFIHCSRPEQVQRVARRFYQAVPDLILLWIDPDRVQPEIRWEEADGETFPHLYGPLNLEAVVSIQDYDPSSEALFPPERSG